MNFSGVCGVVILALTLSGCGSVKEYEKVSQPTGLVLIAGIGDTILTIKSEKNLPNAFGNADIFGRKTPTGITTVQFVGLNGSHVKFVRQSASIETGATTMNSSPQYIPNIQTTNTTGYVGSTPVYGTSTTYGQPTIIAANPPKAQVFEQAPVVFEIDLNNQKEFTMSGMTIELVAASATSLTYRIKK